MVLLLVVSLLPVAAALAGATALSASSLAPRPRPRRLGLAAALMLWHNYRAPMQCDRESALSRLARGVIYMHFAWIY